MSEDGHEIEPGFDPVEDDEARPSAGSEGRAESIAERIREKRKAIAASKWHFMDIPGYDGELVGKFKRMRWESLADIADHAESSHTKRKALNGHADVIATACEELLIRKVKSGGEEELVPMHELFADEFEGRQVRFDSRLSTWLGVNIEGTPTARKVVFGVFNNDLAVTAFHNELGAWMQSSKSEEDEAFTTT